MNTPYNKQKADFFARFDDATFTALAPILSTDESVVRNHGVLNLAQCAQENGEADNAWSLEYLRESFLGQTGFSYLSDEVDAELVAIWNEATKQF